MIPLEELKERRARFWQPGWGSVSAAELFFIQQQIVSRRPGLFVEIGTASGLSAGFIAAFLSENHGERLVTLDFNEVFFADKNKPVGFLIGKICPHPRVEVNCFKKLVSADLHRILGNEVDMAFVDANHQHPWPTLDTIALIPLMKESAIILHHDLALYEKQDKALGIGPKFLFDQFPEKSKREIDGQGNNIFYLTINGIEWQTERCLAKSLLIPWNVQSTISSDLIERFREVVKYHYSKSFLDDFDVAVRRYA